MVELVTQQIPTSIGLMQARFAHTFGALLHQQRTFDKLNAQWLMRSEQVSFKGLYQALLALKTTHSDHCPACVTPLEHVTRDPYHHVEAGLAQLLELVELEGLREKSKQTLQQTARELKG